MSQRSNLTSLLSFSSGLIFTSLITFAVLKWLEIPAGNFIDWIIGIATFAWLMVISTIPWDIYFEAQTVLVESKTSKENDIKINEKHLAYVGRVATLSLSVAILLHLLSAAGLYYIAYQEISVVGYYGAWAALLLTFLRPTVRLYDYLSDRLATIREEVLFPREDVALMKYEIEEVKNKIEALVAYFDLDNEESMLNTQRKMNRSLLEDIKSLRFEMNHLKENNQLEHDKISKETRHAVAQLTEDGKFIDNIVEIIRFIKKV